MISQTEKLWRTLVRVAEINEQIVKCVVPCFSDETVELPISAFPSSMVKKLRPGYRFFAHANIGAEKIQDLKIENIEHG